jgi:predicted permease
LLLRSFAQVLGANRGFQTENRMFFEVAMPRSDADDEGTRATQFRADLLSRITSMNQVVAAAAISLRPLQGQRMGMGFSAADRPRPSGDAVPWASWRYVTRDYFRVMDVPFVAGRDFTDHDLIANPWRVIVSRRVAEELWPGENAVGRTINLWEGQNGPPAEVIGVVQDMLDWGLEEGATFAVYMPYYGARFSPVQFVVHTTASPLSLVPRLRAMLAEIDPNLPLSRAETLEDMVGANVASRRFMMMLLGGFAGVALLLALAGVYGVLSYTVAQRRSEMGMRIALGGSPASILRLIVGQGMRPVAIGLMLGLAGALALSRLMTSLLFGVTPADVPTYAGVAALLAVAALGSAVVPAHGALRRLDVLATLREE